MSMGNEIRELKAQVEALNGTLEEQAAELVTATEAITAAETALAASEETMAARIEELGTEHATAISEAEAKLAEIVQHRDGLIAAHETLEVEKDAAITEAATQKEAAEKAQNALANPAFADAGARGEDEPAAEAGDGEDTDTAALLAQYDKVKAEGTTKDRAMFWAENEVALKEALKEQE